MTNLKGIPTNILPNQIFLQEEDGIKFKRILPFGFHPSDFDQANNLIELENISTGEKTWLPVVRIFNRELKVGSEYVVPVGGDKGYKLRLKTFTEAVEKNRSYVVAVFEKVSDLEKLFTSLN